MTKEKIEELYIRSLDEVLDDSETRQLTEGMTSFPELTRQLAEFKKLREAVARKQPATFGPYFAQKVIAKIQQGRVEIETQIAFFFKKYQMAALGVFIALLAVNVIFSDRVDVPSILGVEDTPQPVEDDLLSFDFYYTLTND